jgi:single-strand DNA-binding protein
MASFNRVIVAGNLTRDPEYRNIASGQSVCRLGLATNRQFKNRQTGSLVQEVCYIDVDVWGAQAETCRQYLQKGRPVLIEGRLKLDSWEDQTGQKRSKHSIVAERVVFLGNGATAEAGAFGGNIETSSEDEFMLNPNNPVEKDVLDQIAKVQGKMKANKATSTTGEIDFKDEQPFTEDFPF